MPLARVARARLLPVKIIKAVHMAGGGASAAEIATALGEIDAAGVYAMLSRHGIALVPKLGKQTAFPIVLEKRTFESITERALAHDIDPRALCGAILNEVVDDPDLLHSLVVDATVYDGKDLKKPAKRQPEPEAPIETAPAFKAAPVVVGYR
jgi:hypothetical protein